MTLLKFLMVIHQPVSIVGRERRKERVWDKKGKTKAKG